MSSPHSQNCPETSHALSILVEHDEPWSQQVLAGLPLDYAQQARTYRAFVRTRGVSCAGDLLRGLFAYVFCFGSLRQVGCWASLVGLSQISERAWGKRVRQARLWILWLLEEALGGTGPLEAPALPARWKGRILLIDSTSLRGRARQGDYWRIHTSYDLLTHQMAQVRLADQHVAESLTQYTALPGDILVADRGYCKPPAVKRTLESGVELVVRLHWSSFPLYHQDGSQFDLLGWVRTLPSPPTECRLFLTSHCQHPVRVLAVRLSEAAAQRERARRRRKSSKNGCAIQADTLFMADWLLLLTSLDDQRWPLEQVLLLYRARWQIELLFKRIKQLARLHRLASDHPETNEAVLAILLLGWALVEQQALPWRESLHEQAHNQQSVGEQATPIHPVSSWQVYALLIHLLRSAIVGRYAWKACGNPNALLGRFLTSHPQQRIHRESVLCQVLKTHLADIARG